ncbi:cadherin-23-like [Saccoglossus kowalevskii]
MELTTEVTTEALTTMEPTTDLTSEALTTMDPTTDLTTEAETTMVPTIDVTTKAETTMKPTTEVTTEALTTMDSTTDFTTEALTTMEPTTDLTTEALTTMDPTTDLTSEALNTMDPTTYLTTEALTTMEPTTDFTTEALTTMEPTTEVTAEALTTMVPTADLTTEAETTMEPTTEVTTEALTTMNPTTDLTTEAETTMTPTTEVTTEAVTTMEPTTDFTTETLTTMDPTTYLTTEAETTMEPTTNVTTEAVTTMETTDVTTEAVTTMEPTTNVTTEAVTTMETTTDVTTEAKTTMNPTTNVTTEIETTMDPTTDVTTVAVTTEDMATTMDSSTFLFTTPYADQCEVILGYENVTVQMAQILENEPRGTFVIDLLLREQYASYDVIYEFAETVENFAIDDNGIVTTLSSLDREREYSFHYAVIGRIINESKCFNLPVAKELFITVLDVNDNSPHFTSDVYTGFVDENSDVDASVTMITPIQAIDKDEGMNAAITYSLSGLGSEMFRMNQSTGEITTDNKDLDYEDTAIYNLTVTASDCNGGPGSLQSNASIVIQINDRNDNAPVFEQFLYEYILEEDTEIGHSVDSLVANDLDDELNGRVDYYLEDGDHGDFKINKYTGELYVTGELDRERTPFYILNITACDNGKTISQTKTTVIIEISDVNDNAPSFTQEVYSGNLQENLNNGSYIISVSAEDPDSGSNGDIIYKLDTNDFTIEEVTGNIYTNRVFDYEVTQDRLHTFNVTGMDMGMPSRISSSLVVIRVLDVNDNPPMFTQDQYNGTILDGSLTYSPVVVTHAFDLDSGDNGDISYHITDNTTYLFEVDYKGVVYLTDDVAYDDLIQILDPQDSLQFSVVSRDNGTPTLLSKTTIFVTILKMQDNSNTTCVYNTSWCGSFSYTFEIAENSPVHSVVGDISDEAASMVLPNYDILEESARRLFGVDSGMIHIVGSIDREIYETVIFTVVISANRPDIIKYIPVYILVTDVNDNVPIFNPLSYIVTYLEYTPPDTIISIIYASDKDAGIYGKLTYAVKSPAQAYFFMDNNILKNSQKLVIEEMIDAGLQINNGVLDIKIEARDGGYVSTEIDANVKLSISEAQLDSGGRDYQNSTVLENSPAGTNVTRVSAEGYDGYNILYDFSQSNIRNFNINNYTGVVTTTELLDRETRDTYSYEIVAKLEGESACLFDPVVAEILITVLDENDNSPQFLETSYSGTIDENSSSNTVVTMTKDIHATDIDSDYNALIVYTLSGIGHEKFMINSRTAIITTSHSGDPGLDRETNKQYELQVTASDRNGEHNSLSSMRTVTITILDVNDNHPQFEQQTYKYSIEENVRVGFVIDTLTATDADEGNNAIISYSIVNGSKDQNEEADDGTIVLTVFAEDRDLGSNGIVTYSLSISNFTIDSNTGEIYTSSKLDYEDPEGRQYEFYAYARDSSHPFHTSTSTVIVTIKDINDNSPQFTDDRYNGTVEHGQRAEHVVLTVSATDKDSDENGRILYHIINNSTDLFKVDNRGLIQLNGEINYEDLQEKLDEYKSLQFTVVASDGVLSDTALVNVTVIKEVDERLEFHRPEYEVTVMEEQPAPVYVLTVSAGVDNDDIIYGFTHRVDAFSINISTGEIYTVAKLDYELNKHHSFSVVAMDADRNREPRQRMTYTPVLVNVIDVNDNSPAFTNSHYMMTMLEDDYTITSDTVIGKVSANDKDENINAEISYQIIDGNLGTVFSMDEVEGDIYAVGPIDREYKASYSLIVMATDNGLPSRNSTTNVQISVGDVNDNAPTFTLPYYHGDVDENTVDDSVIVFLLATDSDLGENGTLYYSIVDGNDGNFAIDEFTGEIIPSNNASIDFERTRYYNLTVMAKDGGVEPMTSTVTVHIDIHDVNDNAPYFTSEEYSVDIPANTPIGFIVVNITAEDIDTGNNSLIRYYLELPNPDKNVSFEIDELTGAVSVSKSLTTGDEQRKLTVVAKDGGNPTLSSTTEVSIFISELNVYSPNFKPTNYTKEVLENVPTGTSIVTVTATDLDAQNSSQGAGDVYYKIVHGNDDGFFKIDSRSGIIRTNSSIDREKQETVSLVIQAYDGGVPQRSSTASVEIILLDVNDNRPRFDPSEMEVKLSHDSPIGTFVINVNATDPDIEGTITYSLTPSIPYIKNLFSINETSGVIETKAEFNTPEADLKISVEVNDGIYNNYGHFSVVVYYNDYNINPPKFIRG